MNPFHGFEPLATTITKNASRQTYYTIKCLVDRDLIPDAYRAYAYFRWVDDCLDENGWEKPERLAFVNHQKSLLARCYEGDWIRDLCPEERLLASLIQMDRDKHSGLYAYTQNMMAVMAFDAERRGRWISQTELTEYARNLATAVTEALHYFIGHTYASPHSEARYLAAQGAHLTHMLRDTYADLQAGYFNIPREALEGYGITPFDVTHDAYRMWVKNRVQLARTYFKAGKAYLAQVENRRCRLAGYAYIARFAWVLDALERDDYMIQPEYKERKSLGIGLKMLGRMLTMELLSQKPKRTQPRSSPRSIHSSEGSL